MVKQTKAMKRPSDMGGHLDDNPRATKMRKSIVIPDFKSYYVIDEDDWRVLYEIACFVSKRLSADRNYIIGKDYRVCELEVRSDNRLLPASIGWLMGLTRLDLEKSKIESLPASIGQLCNLEYLNLVGTKKLSTLPGEIGNLAKLTTLNLRGSNIASIPPSIGRLRNLKELDLGRCSRLWEVPEEIGDLINLSVLHLARTCIASLPPSIGKLQNLESLFLKRSKKLSVLPEEIGNLTKLKVLGLTSTGITELPRSIAKLKRLMYLGIRHTCIPELQKGNDPNEFFMSLVKQCRSLGSIGGFDIEGGRPNLQYVLACNRARSRILFGGIDNESILATQNLWQCVLMMATRAFASYPTYAYNQVWAGLGKSQALYQLLLDNRESFITFLIDYKTRPPMQRNVYFSYSNIHDTVLKLVSRVKEFHPSVIVALCGEGSLPARMLAAELDIPVLAVSLELADTGAVQKRQWFDEQSEDGRKVFVEKMLIVDEVDDTREKIHYCVEQVTRTNLATNVAVAVVHNKRKTKKIRLPEGVIYLAGATVLDHWECRYPWDAASYGHTLSEHEALAKCCSYDF